MGYVTHEIAISQDSHQHEVVMHQVRVPTRWEDWELGGGASLRGRDHSNQSTDQQVEQYLSHTHTQDREGRAQECASWKVYL